MAKITMQLINEIMADYANGNGMTVAAIGKKYYLGRPVVTDITKGRHPLQQNVTVPPNNVTPSNVTVQPAQAQQPKSLLLQDRKIKTLQEEYEDFSDMIDEVIETDDYSKALARMRRLNEMIGPKGFK